MTFDEVAAEVRATGLGIVGAFHPGPEDGAPPDTGTLFLLGPDGPEMWTAFETAPEARDGAPDPLDRWSQRVIGRLAARLGAFTLFPFGGPPWQPFQKWAMRGEGAAPSPVAMQVTPARGLWASYRGALCFAEVIPLPARTDEDPCAPCHRPCEAACPVDAFSNGRYDVPACVAHLKTPAGAECLKGCLVRRACPAGAGIALPEAARRFHMAAFLRANG